MNEKSETFFLEKFIDELTPEMRKYRQHLLLKKVINLTDLSSEERVNFWKTEVDQRGYKKGDVEGLFGEVAKLESQMQKHSHARGNHPAPCVCQECMDAFKAIMDLEYVLNCLAKLEPGWNIKVERQ